MIIIEGRTPILTRMEEVMKYLLSGALLTALVLVLSTVAIAQDEDMDMEGGSANKISVGGVVGLSIPNGDPGLGGSYDPGFGLRVFGQYDIGDKVKDLKVELSLGYSVFTKKGVDTDGAAATSVFVNAVYNLSSVNITPEIGLFVFGGLGFFSLSWDDTREIDNQSVLGLNGGLGVSYKMNAQMNLNLRLGGYLALTDKRVINGIEQNDDYGHLEVPVMVGVNYSL